MTSGAWSDVRPTSGKCECPRVLGTPVEEARTEQRRHAARSGMMTAMTLPFRPGLLGKARPPAAPAASVVQAWRPPWRGRMLALRLLEAAGFGTMYFRPMAQGSPWHLVKYFHLAMAVLLTARAVSEFCTRVLAERDGVEIVHGLRRTRIAWKDVSQVRPGSRGFGPGWVELVTERVVRLPVAVTNYPELRQFVGAGGRGVADVGPALARLPLS